MFTATVLSSTTHRPAVWEDIPAIVDLGNHLMDAMWGVAEWSIAETEAIVSRPDFKMEEHLHLWHDKAGTLVGMVILGNLQSPPVRPRVMPYISPTIPYLQQLGHEILAWGEATLREKAIPQCPADAMVRTLSWTNRTYAPYITLYQNYGMEHIREYWTMQITLEGERNSPVLPEGVTILPMRYPEERRAMYRISEEAFRDHYGHIDDPDMAHYESWEHQRFDQPSFDPSVWLVVEVNGEYAGFAFCRISTPDNPHLALIDTLGVLPAFRRHGLAGLLLQHAFALFSQRGMHQAELEVDATNITGATRVYERAGMHCAVVWDSYSKVLRDGVELIRQ